jgi:hypothetical protein
VEAREDLKLSIELLADQLNIYFNGCVVLLEYSAHVPKFGRNPNALSDWRSECLEVVHSILTRDLRISTRSWGAKVLGGYLWRRNGDSWLCVGGGGSPLMFLGRHRTTEYRRLTGAGGPGRRQAG